MARDRRRLSTRGSQAAVDPPAWSVAGSAGSGGAVAPARGKRKIGAGFPCNAGDPASRCAAGHCPDRPHESGCHRRRSGQPQADRPSDADPGDRRRHAHGDRLSPLSRAAMPDVGGSVFDPRRYGQERLACRSRHCRRVAGAWDSARHSRRQRRRVPRVGVRTGVRRARGRSDLQAAGNAAVRRAYRAVDRHESWRPGSRSRSSASITRGFIALSAPRRTRSGRPVSLPRLRGRRRTRAGS